MCFEPEDTPEMSDFTQKRIEKFNLLNNKVLPKMQRIQVLNLRNLKELQLMNC